MAGAAARRAAIDAGEEILNARVAAGLSQRAASARAGVSASQLSRLERGDLAHPSLELLYRAARGVGLVASVKLYPSDHRVRDAAQLALLRRLEARLGAPLCLRREVPLPIAGDRRAWDGRIEGGPRGHASVEAESKLLDTQAVARRIAIKQRDDPEAGPVILLVNRTAHNRRVLAEHREALRGQFPLDGSAILRSLSAGQPPPASGILML